MTIDSRAGAMSIPVLLCAVISGCGGASEHGNGGDGQGVSGGTSSASAGTGSGTDTAPGGPQAVAVHLVPRAGFSGVQRVNFAIPLAPGDLGDAAAVRVLSAGAELASARRALARYPDGSLRSVQIQIDVDVSAEADLDVRLGEAPTAGDIDLVPVEDTLDPPDGTRGPRVWARLPAAWLSASGALGPSVPEADVAGTPLAAWSDRCDYDRYNTAAFLATSGDASVWLYDRGTAMYRGYARRGDASTLESAYRETAIYRAGITGSGSATAIGVPGKANDMKYYYAQNMAIHYLLSGDDRFRESAEQIAFKMSRMWSPRYSGGDAFWTERHAGFLLLAHLWASMISDDRSAELAALADGDVAEYLQLQASYPAGYDDPGARCLAHSSDAHGEGYGYWGCSPWMSAILADGLDAYARERGGAKAEEVRAALVKLGRAIAEQGRDADGRPYYWMGEGSDLGEIDDYDEHWGESAYVVAMAWFHDGKRDAALREAADELVDGFASLGAAPHMRSFNWQCRSAVAAPYYLK